jgi:hypothetical protein
MSKKQTAVYTIVFLFVSICNAQSIQYPHTSRYTAMAAYSKNFADVFSGTSNQAAFGKLKNLSIGIYVEKKFLIEELNYYSLAVSLPVQFGGIGISVSQFGYNAYKETQISAAYGKALGKIDIGVQFNYYALVIPGYGKSSLINIEGGAILNLTEQLFAGLHIFNPTGNKFGPHNSERLSSSYIMGLGFEVSEKVLVAAEIVKQVNKPVGINAGLQYVFDQKFFARLGLLSQTNSFYFGAGWKWRVFRVDVTSNYHNQLGFSPGLMILYQDNNNEE